MEKDKIIEQGKTQLLPDDLVYGFKEPLQSCKQCNGTGKEAWRQDGSPIMCRCLTRKSGNLITFEKFQSIANNKRSK